MSDIALNFALFFQDNPDVEVSYVFSNRSNAGVIDRAKRLNIRTFVFDRNMFFESDEVLNRLSEISPDLIILAGFLWLVPEKMVKTFPNRIINIHPALLPMYGGKGMYGDRVHQAVIDNGEKEAGITIHYVNEKYDEGNIIFQGKCLVEKDDTPESLAGKVHQLEYEHYPRVITQLLMNQ
jgi:phosphoribosylglycinamide formyltransferase-1